MRDGVALHIPLVDGQPEQCERQQELDHKLVDVGVGQMPDVIKD